MLKNIMTFSMFGLSLLMLIICNGCGGKTTEMTTITPVQTAVTTFSLGSSNGSVGDVINIPVTMNNANIRAVSCTINYDSTVVAPGDNGDTSKSIIDNGLIVGSGLVCRRKWGNNSVTIHFVCAGDAQNKTITTIPFKALKQGTSSLTVSDVVVYDYKMQPVAMTRVIISQQITVE